MKKIIVGKDEPGYYKDTEHLVLEIDGKGVLLAFIRQIDDLLISSPNGDILIAWDIDHEIKEFDETNCMFLSQRDNLKELGNLKAQLIALRAFDTSKAFVVYITAQRN